jgi:predicted RNA-binding protein YlxR (DUF448 family)
LTTREPSADGPQDRASGLVTRGRPRHIPERTCIACRETGPKRGFVRLVRTPAGTVEVDLTGRKPGRGAYLHSDPACWQAVLKKDRVAAALKTTLSPEDRAALRAYAEGLES